MRTLKCLVACFAMGTLSGLETKPWLGDPYGFEFQSAFTYSRFRHVEGASVQPRSAENTEVLLLDVGFTSPSSTMDFQMEGELAQSARYDWTLRSAALQGRLQLMDDIAGDPVSVVLGINFRGALGHPLKDVSTPYASQYNVELTGSVGKEWSQEGMWTMRTYGFATLGMANRGYPWTRELFVWQYNWQDTHRLSLFAEGDFGFGGKQHINVRHFDGWAKIQHHSIDLGLAYGYHFTLYGTLSVSYAHRVYAHNYPEHVNFFTLSYCVPFSLF